MKTDPNPYIMTLKPFKPGIPAEQLVRQYGVALEDIVRLDSNENPLGMSQRAQEAIKATVEKGSCYPEQLPLLEALAARNRVNPLQVILGNGSNDIIDMIGRVFLDSGDESIMSQYSFSAYDIAARAVGATSIQTPAKDYGYDLAALGQAITDKTKVIWIANPNNPTGTLLSYDAIKQFLQDTPAHIIVVLDEAYFEYLDDEDQIDSAEWLSTFPNLIITRTFSKMYGLAGLRLGYALASEEIIDLLNRVRQPYNVSSLALAGGLAALDDQQFVEESRRVNAQERSRMADGLAALGLNTVPAYGNFVTVEIPDALEVYEALLKQGVIVRPLAGYGLTSHLRVSVGAPADNDRFIALLTNVLGVSLGRAARP